MSLLWDQSPAQAFGSFQQNVVAENTSISNSGVRAGGDQSKTSNYFSVSSEFSTLPQYSSSNMRDPALALQMQLSYEQLSYEDAALESLANSPASILTPDLPPQDFPNIEAGWEQIDQFVDMNLIGISGGQQDVSGADCYEMFSDNQVYPQQRFATQLTALSTAHLVREIGTPSELEAQQIQRRQIEQNNRQRDFMRQSPGQDPWTAQRQMRYQASAGPGMVMFDDLEPGPDSTGVPSNASVTSTSPAPSNSRLPPSHSGVRSYSNTQDPRQSAGLSPPGGSFLTPHLAPPRNQALDPSVCSFFPDNSSPVSGFAGKNCRYDAPSPSSDAIFSSRSENCGVSEGFQEQQDFSIMPTVSETRGPMITQPIPRLFGPEPPPKPTFRNPARVQSHRNNQNGSGGRRRGSHLKPQVAAGAQKMRLIHACWPCVFQRDKCKESPDGSPCERCVKRAQRPGCENRLPCSRQHLNELTPYFLPDFYTSIYDRTALVNYADRHIRAWDNHPIQIQLLADPNFPPIECEVYEFVPKSTEIQIQVQWFPDVRTGKLVRAEIRSPPLGLNLMDDRDVRFYETYVDEIVDNYFDQFARVCFAEEKDDFQKRLLQLMHGLEPADKIEARLLRSTLRLIVVTYLMSHSLMISVKSLQGVLGQLRHSRMTLQSTRIQYITPKLANRQHKLLFCHLHQKIMDEVLSTLQQVIKSSKGSEKWVSAFCAMIGLAMVHEDTQKQIKIIMRGRADRGEISRELANSDGERACQIIDSQFEWMSNLFRWKYGRDKNPLKDLKEFDFSAKPDGESVLRFAKTVTKLRNEKVEYLHSRQFVSTSQDDGAKYTSRLVARFLLSFWVFSTS